MAMILNITETIHKLKMPFDRGCSMRLYNNNNMRKLHHPNNSNLKLPCPTVSQIFFQCAINYLHANAEKKIVKLIVLFLYIFFQSTVCPLSNILVETEVVPEVIPQQLHPILFHLISIMAMVHRYILVVSKFPEQKSS